MASSGADTSAEDLLRKATLAESSTTRAKYATRGLSQTTDPTMRAMLLRQLYLSHMEGERFDEASEIARAALELGVMPDVACQDLARAYLGAGRHREAVEELRRAGRVGPASRRAFHLWTLGSVLYFNQDYSGAARVLERAARWGATAKPLYEAQVALARCAAGGPLSPTMDKLAALREKLEAVPCGQGYGRFVLGELAHRQGDTAAAKRYLEEFVRRADTGRVALRVGLTAELQRARSLLAALALDSAAKV